MARWTLISESSCSSQPSVCNSALPVWVSEDAALCRLGEDTSGGPVDAAMEKPSAMLGEDFPVWQL